MAMVILALVAALLYLRIGVTQTEFEECREWIQKKQATFRLEYDESSIVRAMTTFPEEPGAFAKRAAALLRPMRDQCEAVIHEAHERAPKTRFEAEFAELELKRKKLLINNVDYFKEFNSIVQRRAGRRF